MSLHDSQIPSIARKAIALAGLAGALSAPAQYPGQLSKSSKDTPELRAIAVLEWTGEPGKPKASRLVPVAVLDNGQLQDGGVYLARPQPMALGGEVEYELEENGRPIGLYDIKDAGQEQGSWVGYGAWKSMPVAKPAPSMAEVARTKIDASDDENDHPVLHRKKHSGDAGSSKGSTTGSTSSGSSAPGDPDRPTLHKKSSSDDSTSSSSSAPSDPDRPTLHKKDTSSDSSDTSSTSTTTSTASDPDRPTLHRKTSDDDSASSSTSAPSDPDRPTLKKGKKSKPQEETGYSEGIAGVTDPDRPSLKRGKSTADSIKVAPTLMGMPQDLQQAVAISDAKSHPEHPWTFSWSSPDDQAKMQSTLEQMARDALGLKPPPSPAPKKSTTRKPAHPAPPAPQPAPLLDEQFHVFELAYGSGATMVLSAHTPGPFAQQKFVTLIAQPDLYGNVMVLLKSVTDGSHLDESPRMRLVDAVDAMADNRGELLFELRGSTQRQFALYRVLRGQAEKIFVSGGGEFGIETTN